MSHFFCICPAACSGISPVGPSHPAHGSLQTVCLMAYAPGQYGLDIYFVSGNCGRGAPSSSPIAGHTFEEGIVVLTRYSLCATRLGRPGNFGKFRILYDRLLLFPHRAGQKLACVHLFSATSQVPGCLSAWSLTGD